MSGSPSSLRCRECKETIDADADACPYCGTSVRSSGSLVALVVVGGLMGLGSLFDIGSLWFFGAIGFLIAFIGIALFYSKRQRLTAEPTGDVNTESTEGDLFE